MLSMSTSKALYQQDFASWCRETSQLLRDGRLAEVDLEHVAEEIQDMGKREQRNVLNRARVLLIHLLKWKYQPAKKTSSWAGTIDEQRSRLQLILDDSPSLRNLLCEKLEEVYRRAVRAAGLETTTPTQLFPKTCPWSLEEILNDEFWPR